MKFRCERDVLVEALTTAGRAVTTRNTALPVLAGLRLALKGDELSVAGTDLDLSILVTITVTGQEDGTVVIPARLSADIVRALEPGAVRIDADEEEVRIASGRSQFAVRMYQADDFPKLPNPPPQAVTLPAGALADALRQVVRAASSDEGVPIITGVLVAAEGGNLRLVATDKYRLAVRDLPGAGVLGEGQHVLVPSRALGELQRLLTNRPKSDESDEIPGGGVTLRLGEHDATFELGPVRLTTRLIPGDFPNYRQLIPTGYPNRLIVGREPLLEALRRVRLLVRDQITSVRVALRPEGVTLTVTTADLGTATEDVDAKYEGTEMTVAFNPGYLIDGVEAITADEVLIEVLDPVKQVTLRANGPAGPEGEYLYLLMPVRVPT